jgi:hypothetical protein
MTTNYIFGRDTVEILGGSPRYFYGLRRTDDGELFLAKVDQTSPTDSVQINAPGNSADNYTNFDAGQDFYEGRDVFHNLVFENLNYEQYKWDDRSVYYYINNEGELVVRINQKYTYDENSSSNGLGQ